MADAKPNVEILIVEDGVDSALDMQVKILNHGVTDDPEDRLLHLSYAAPDPAEVRGEHITSNVRTLRKILAAVSAPGEGDQR